jgi:hypothetical protein
MSIRNHAVVSLLCAWYIKLGNRMNRIRFAPPATSTPVPMSELPTLIRWSNRLVRFGTFGSKNRCFFRTYIIVRVLRKWGYEANMNVGMKNLRSPDDAEGHCWPTLHEGPIGEPGDPRIDYPIQLGVGSNGVAYWVGPNAPCESDGALRRQP